MFSHNLIKAALYYSFDALRKGITENQDYSKTEIHENVLLFHAAFSNFFEAALIKDISAYCIDLEKELNQLEKRSKESTSNDLSLNLKYIQKRDACSSIFVLESILAGKSFTFLEQKLINLCASRKANSRRWMLSLFAFYVNPNNKEKSKQEKIVEQRLIDLAETNLKYNHFGNNENFALIQWFSNPTSQKEKHFKYLLRYAEAVRNKNDNDVLAQYAYQRTNPVLGNNPFHGLFITCMQQTLTLLTNFNENYLNKPLKQGNLFADKLGYNFNDIRFSPYMK